MQETWAIHNVYPGISWTPDGRRSSIWAGGQSTASTSPAKPVSDIPFHVAGTRFVEDALHVDKRIGDDSFDVKMTRFAHASPDGRRVVYEALGSLWIKDVGSTAAPRRLTRSDEREAYPVWSRDGRQIAYVTWDDDKGGAIKVVGAAGGTGRTVTPDPGYYREPAFSPDGRLIAYRKGSDGFLATPLWGRDPGLYVLSLATGASQRRRQIAGLPAIRQDQRPRLLRRSATATIKCSSRSRSTGADPSPTSRRPTPRSSRCRPTSNSSAGPSATRPMSCPSSRTGRSIDIAADAKALPQSRISTDAGDYLHWSGDSSTLYWTQGADLFARRLICRASTAQDRRSAAGCASRLRRRSPARRAVPSR